MAWSRNTVAPGRRDGKWRRLGRRGRYRALVRWQAYAKTASLAATSRVREGVVFWLELVVRITRLAVYVGLWRVVLRHDPVQRKHVLVYAVLAEALAQLLSCRTQLEHAFWDGSVTTRFLRPLSIFEQLTLEALGRWLLGLVAFSIPILAFAPFLGVDPRPASVGTLLGGMASVVLAVAVGLSIEFLVSGIAIAGGLHPYMVNSARSAITYTTSGVAIPLALFPLGVGRVLSWLPFAAMASAPLRILTGTGRVLPLLASQLAWALLLWPLARLVWVRSQERVVGFGG